MSSYLLQKRTGIHLYLNNNSTWQGKFISLVTTCFEKPDHLLNDKNIAKKLIEGHFQ